VTRQLVEYMANSLADHPDELKVIETEEDGVIVYRLQVSPRDIGKVIGRHGRVARAMRTLLKVSAIQNHTRCVLEIE
jgi:predicted RNA-binding protein YlqC (UPF0109 family)